MTLIIVVAALILNPIARRKRAAQTPGHAQKAEMPMAPTNGTEGSDLSEKPDLELGDKSVVNGGGRSS